MERQLKALKRRAEGVLKQSNNSIDDAFDKIISIFDEEGFHEDGMKWIREKELCAVRKEAKNALKQSENSMDDTFDKIMSIFDEEGFHKEGREWIRKRRLELVKKIAGKMLEKAEKEGTLEEYGCDASVFEEITQLFNEKEFYMSGKKWVAKEKSSLLLELARKREAKDGISHFDETFDKIAEIFRHSGLEELGERWIKAEKYSYLVKKAQIMLENAEEAEVMGGIPCIDEELDKIVNLFQENGYEEVVLDEIYDFGYCRCPEEESLWCFQKREWDFCGLEKEPEKVEETKRKRSRKKKKIETKKESNE